MSSTPHVVRVRYGDCDMQGVVFNANYLSYVDDAVDVWMRVSLANERGLEPDHRFDLHSIGFDFMVKKFELVFHGPVTYGDLLELTCSVKRWGTTSFDVEVSGAVARANRFDATLTYVGVDPIDHNPITIPEVVRAALR